MTIDPESFDLGKQWFFESKICLYRALMLSPYPWDNHGKVEALQHCFELSIKSLYLMLGLKYPRDHDAAKNLDKVTELLFEEIPWTDQEKWPPLEAWIKRNSRDMKKLHISSMYGDDKMGVLASKLFTDEQVSELMVNVSAIWSFVYHTMMIVGHQNGLVNQNEIDDYGVFVEMSQSKDLRGRKFLRYFKRVFDSSRMNY